MNNCPGISVRESGQGPVVYFKLPSHKSQWHREERQRTWNEMNRIEEFDCLQFCLCFLSVYWLVVELWMLSSTSPQSHLHNRRKQRWEKTKQDNRWRKTEKQIWFQNKATHCKVMSGVTYPGIPVFHTAPWLVRSQIWTGRNLAKLLCYGCFLCSTSGFPATENEKRNSIPTQFHTY